MTDKKKTALELLAATLAAMEPSGAAKTESSWRPQWAVRDERSPTDIPVIPAPAP